MIFEETTFKKGFSVWLYVVDVQNLVKEQSTNWAILKSWEVCFRRTIVPAYDSIQNRRIEHFLHHKPAPFASGPGLLERSSTLSQESSLWSRRSFVGVIAILLTAHTMRMVPLAQYHKCLSR
jgi:hypothetical protein